MALFSGVKLLAASSSGWVGEVEWVGPPSHACSYESKRVGPIRSFPSFIKDGARTQLGRCSPSTPDLLANGHKIAQCPDPRVQFASSRMRPPAVVLGSYESRRPKSISCSRHDATAPRSTTRPRGANDCPPTSPRPLLSNSRNATRDPRLGDRRTAASCGSREGEVENAAWTYGGVQAALAER